MTKVENIIPIIVGTNGGEFLTIHCVDESDLQFNTRVDPVKEFTLLDKFGNHLVFVNWDEKISFVCDTNDNLDEYKVGKQYLIKMPNS